MEKRLYERHTANVPASARVSSAEPIPCVIRDYCNGGLFLELAQPKPSARGVVRSGDPIYVRFPSPSTPDHAGVRLRADVARVEDTGFGVAFRRGDTEVPAAVAALRRLARDQQDPPLPPPARHAQDAIRRHSLLERSLAMFRAKLKSNAARLLTRTQQVLFEAAAQSSDPRAGQDYFRASELMRAQAGLIEAAWMDALAGPAATGARVQRAPVGKSEVVDAGLELVDKARFDRWVILAGLASRMDASLHLELFPLAQRLSYLTGAAVTKDANPIGPGAAIWSLSKALDSVGLDIEAQRTVLRGLEDDLRAVLRSAYEAVNRELRHAGVLPDIERRPSGIARPDSDNTQIRRSTRPERQTGVVGVLGKVLSFLSKPPHPGETGTEPPPGKAGVRMPPYGRGQVLEALSHLQATRKLSLPDEVQATLGRQEGQEGGAGSLPEDIRGVLAGSEQLIEFLKSDERVDGLVAPALERIEIPLAKVAVEHPDFVRDPKHPAVEVVNDLGRLALALSAEPADARRSSEVNALISRVSESLVQDARPGLSAFADARDTLAPYVREYQQLFAHNVERVTAVSQGQERLDQAKRAVRGALAEIIGQEPVPSGANALLQLGWAALLTLTWLDHGPESDTWSQYLGAIEALIRLLGPQPDASSPNAGAGPALLEVLERGLSLVPYDPVRQQALMERLRSALRGDADLLRQLSREQQPAQLDVLKLTHSPEQSIPPSPEQEKTLASWMPVIRSISVGDWLVERRSRDLSRPINLAWTSARGDRFVFVDGRGFRALERTLTDLASNLESGQLSVLEDGRLPLVERAVQRVLRRSYEEVVYDSAHDSLTGLMNRRTFERHIDETVQQARREHGRNVLLILDLDRFKLINDLSGHEGGDRLLKDVAGVIRAYLTGESVIARTGDDEFGILLRDCTRDAGYQVAETQRRAVENMDFRLEGQRFRITISIGLVDIDERTESASRVLMQADAACFLAKEAGRNLTKVFEVSDSEVQRHQGTLQQLPLVEEAVQEGRITLYLQLIQPVFFDEGLLDHYEVLLRVLDKNGLALSPEAFILAAEQFDRMRSLDRWVIEHVFRWIDDHTGLLEQVGGFSINLSGQSLGDDAMLQLIMGHIERTPLPPEKLAFEITETAMVRHLSAAQAFVQRIKGAGCKLYLDDFGTGMSSYSYLKNFPVDCVKIDGSFVRNIAADEKDFALVKSITEIAHFGNRLVIAEHVETEAILVRLREIGVDFAQGYAIGRPFPLSRLLST